MESYSKIQEEEFTCLFYLISISLVTKKEIPSLGCSLGFKQPETINT